MGLRRVSIFQKIVKELPDGSKVLSIGDRYCTDIEPMLSIGGDGILVKKPGAVEKLLEDLKTGVSLTDSYEWFCINK